MRLRNKKTGEIWTLTNRNEGTSAVIWVSNGSQTHVIESIEELANNFEDYEEPKFIRDYWFIDSCGGINKQEADILGANRREIGNYFETKEEAEKAVEKLKALKRLKDNGFKFEGIKQDYTRFFSQQKPIRIGRKYLQFNKAEDEEWLKENWNDLNLLFGEEE